MQIISSPTAKNESTYIVLADFTDEDGAAVVPNSVTFSLTNAAGTIINSRDDVSVTPAASIAIVLSGADIDREDGADRIVTIEALYNSATYGSDLPLNDQGKFTISDWIEEV